MVRHNFVMIAINFFPFVHFFTKSRSSLDKITNISVEQLEINQTASIS